MPLIVYVCVYVGICNYAKVFVNIFTTKMQFILTKPSKLPENEMWSSIVCYFCFFVLYMPVKISHKIWWSHIKQEEMYVLCMYGDKHVLYEILLKLYKHVGI